MGFLRLKIKRHDRSWLTQKNLVPKQRLEMAAKVLLAAIHQEIDRERALESGKGPGGLPKSSRFKNSFRCPVVGREIQIVSSWPTLDALIDGRKPFQMTWLTQQAGVGVVPMEGPHEEVLYRTTPRHKAEAWWHPGYRKHEFLDRAVEKALPKMEKIILEGLIRELKSLPPV